MSEEKTTSASDDPLTVLSKFYVQMEAKISTRWQRRRKHRHRMLLTRVVLKCCAKMEAKIWTRWQRRSRHRHRLMLSLRVLLKFYVQMEAKISTRWHRRRQHRHRLIISIIRVVLKYYLMTEGTIPLDQLEEISVVGECIVSRWRSFLWLSEDSFPWSIRAS